MILTIEGKDYEFKGEYRFPRPGEYFMGKGGTALNGTIHSYGTVITGARAILHPVPVTHVYGGIVFVETGEVRYIRGGEWALTSGIPVLWDCVSMGEYIILRPVGVEGQEGCSC